MATTTKQPEAETADECLTDIEVGKLFKVHKRTILRWETTLDHFPKARKFRGVRRFLRSEVTAFMRQWGVK